MEKLKLKELTGFWFKTVKRALFAFLARSSRRSNFVWSYSGKFLSTLKVIKTSRLICFPLHRRMFQQIIKKKARDEKRAVLLKWITITEKVKMMALKFLLLTGKFSFYLRGALVKLWKKLLQRSRDIFGILTYITSEKDRGIWRFYDHLQKLLESFMIIFDILG